MKVHILHSANSGVGHYRSWMPAKWLARQPGWTVTRYPDWQTMDRCLSLPPKDCPILQNIAEADLTVWGWFYNPAILQAASQLRNITKTPLMLELDDDVLNVPKEHAAYDAYAEHTEEEMFETLTLPIEAADVMQKRGWMVRMSGNGTVEVRRYKYPPFREPFKQTLAAMDGLTVTTPWLAEHYGPLVDTDNTHILPNCYDPEEWADLKPAPRTDYPSILWAGSMAHNGNLLVVRDALLQVFKEIPTAKLHIIGDVNLPIFHNDKCHCDRCKGTGRRLPQDRLVKHGWYSIPDYRKALMDCGAWVGIAPLEDNSFNKAKSHIRWMEYSLAGIPSVCSPLPEYLDWGVGGADFATTVDEWAGMLRYLLESATVRADKADAARTLVAHCNIERHIHKWAAAYTQAVIRGPKRVAAQEAPHGVPGDQRGPDREVLPVAPGA